MAEDILKSLQQAFKEQDPDKAGKIAKEAVDAGIPAIKVLLEGCMPAIKEIDSRSFYSEGAYYEAPIGDAYLTDLIMVAECLEEALKHIKPKLEANKAQYAGRMVIGVVEGDIHDIGKSIVTALLKSAGFDVIDLGNDVPAATFVQKAKEYNADLIGCSMALVTVKKEMGRVREEAEKAGLRDDVRLVCGGQTLGPEEYKRWGFDSYAKDAVAAVGVVEEQLRILRELKAKKGKGSG